jgi:hypothetical protein
MAHAASASLPARSQVGRPTRAVAVEGPAEGLVAEVFEAIAGQVHLQGRGGAAVNTEAPTRLPTSAVQPPTLRHRPRHQHDGRRRREDQRTVRWILKIIRQLYAIEDQLRRNNASPAERERVRQNNSRRRIEFLRRAIDHLLTKNWARANRKVHPYSEPKRATSANAALPPDQKNTSSKKRRRQSGAYELSPKNTHHQLVTSAPPSWAGIDRSIDGGNPNRCVVASPRREMIGVN